VSLLRDEVCSLPALELEETDAVARHSPTSTVSAPAELPMAERRMGSESSAVGLPRDKVCCHLALELEEINASHQLASAISAPAELPMAEGRC